jgi:eight-cysteine-cluster-containing protein
VILLLRACAGASEAPAPAPVPVPPPPAERETLLLSPKRLYEGCKELVEGPSSPGECATDGECAPVGCNLEVCARRGADVATACEVLPCFQVLDRCGCVEGACTWSLKLPANVAPGLVPPP